ncbi:polysaccharide biosynthesis protein [Aeromicrobium senzhongii]|uniref:Polysaccharide biosynthesis protein n=1 Tax=Aeromicrobium senzhongii TaxID=2663859 RepID=A0ABX6SUA3_9ACTN|nr:polysaccharide biosynthesis protein [Aeromicrobium senzhongii]MTB88010.1 polysaccharide biosynthesis protein [Aeromicrobium senzhongii]QNL94981.1 polysaccharide biosynthesis protein [Aeromicrobium senzhongii]
MSTGLGIVVTRLLIENYGVDSYAQYMLLVGLIALVPFADLGISASIINTVAGSDDPRNDPRVRGVLITCLRILAVSMMVILVITAVVTGSGVWESLLGDGLMPETGPAAAAACLVVFAMTLGIGYGQRILIALGKNHIVVLLGLVQTPIVLTCIITMLLLDIDAGGYLAIAAYGGIFVAAAIAMVMASRALAPMLRLAYRDALRVRSVRGARVFDTALPLLVQMIALPIAMQSSRIVLSHVASRDELAQYSLAAQMFLPIVGVAMAAGVSLWPVFARERAANPSSISSPHAMALWFGVAACVVGAMVAVASPWLAEIASGGQIRLDAALVAAFVVLVIVQAAKNPLGNFLTDARGLRFQAIMVTLMMPWNIVASVFLSMSLGAIGPVIASISGVMIFQLAANWIYATRTAVMTR